VEKKYKAIEQENSISKGANEYSKISEESINPDDFQYLDILGEGEFGKIYLVKRIKKDNFYYSMKIETFDSKEEAIKSQRTTKIIKDFIKKTNSTGVIKIFGDILKKNNNVYNYYILMEKAERDMEQELKIRCNSLIFYTETDLINILTQLILVCSQLQKNNIAHRDIKPQNILIVKGLYKLSDFGEAIVLKTKENIMQIIKGTELFMSPILFFGLKNKCEKVKHNAYKSDVFSLGLCILLAATLNYDSICQIREVNDMNKIKDVIIYFLSLRYSINFISFLITMLEIDENKRPDFIQLENMIAKK
jgi:serine/threonine protein kinase